MDLLRISFHLARIFVDFLFSPCRYFKFIVEKIKNQRKGRVSYVQMLSFFHFLYLTISLVLGHFHIWMSPSCLRFSFICARSRSMLYILIKEFMKASFNIKQTSRMRTCFEVLNLMSTSGWVYIFFMDGWQATLPAVAVQRISNGE